MKKPVSFFVVNEKCNGCLSCVENCPSNALAWKDEAHTRTILHNMARCVRCANCWRICPQKAIEFQYFLENEWVEVNTLELLRCQICGEPVCTAALKETVKERMGVAELDAFCPKHKGFSFAARKAYPVKSKMGAKEGGKI